MATNLTANFTLEEFQDRGFPRSPTPKEVFLLRNLVYMLQKIRNKIGLPMEIKSCYRDRKKNEDLIRQGYNPSETTDHFFGQSIPLSSMNKIKLYGPIFDLSIGAIDFKILGGIDMLKAYEQIVQMHIKDEIQAGQLIYEEDKNKGFVWIHISNPRTLLYSKVAVECLFPRRETLLTSFDGGRSYQVYKG